MVADGRYKYVHAEGGFRPMLFDRSIDPDEFEDRGADPAYADVRAMMAKRLAGWARRMAQRTTMSDKDIIAGRGKADGKGILIGAVEEDDVDARFLARYIGKAAPRPDTGADE